MSAPERPPSSPPPTAGLPPIVQTGAPVLRSPARAVLPEEIPTPEFQALIQTMIAVMRKAPGVGLAAPQIGVPLQIIVLEDREEFLANLPAEGLAERGRVAFATRVFVNPELTPIGDKTATFFEGCLSVDGFVALVERYHEVEVRGLDEHGAPASWRVSGWPARILQHEVDHIRGTLYIDRMKTRSFARGEQAKEHYADKSVSDVIELLDVNRSPDGR